MHEHTDLTNTLLKTGCAFDQTKKGVHYTSLVHSLLNSIPDSGVKEQCFFYHINKSSRDTSLQSTQKPDNIQIRSVIKLLNELTSMSDS